MRNVNKPCAEINEDQNDKDATVVHTSKVQDGNNSDRESNNSPKTSRKPQKRGRAKLQSVPKTSDMCYPGPLQSQPASSSYGCLSLLKEKSSGDESSALDALHTLSGGSVNILRPSSNAEAESSAHIKDESKDNESAEKPSVPVAVPLFEKKDNSRQRKKIKRLSEIASKGMVTRRSARLMKDLHHDGGAISEVEQKDRRNDESAISEVEAMDNMDTTQNAITQQCDSTSKVRSRHKKGILKALVPEHKDSEGVDDSCDNVTYPMNSVVGLLMFFQDKLLINASHHLQGVEVTTYIYPDLLQDKLSHRLSSRFPRRWCMSEWCCSAIDYPWFMKSEFFSEYLNHVKLGHESAKSEFVEYQNHAKLEHGPKLTRVEWGVIRSSFGKPRRFSKQFLHEEREKLSQHRESVGQRNAELQSGVREGLLTDLARPLAVGQRAIACHLKTRELHDGSVLIVDRNHCRVLQIDGSELRRGFEFVMRTNMQREVTRLRWKIMCEVSSSRVNMRDLPGYLLANE